ncbi:beta-keratin-related protein-like [Ahaetulla prasina]|uniref:beta-keratin-related protein-like n=1 Tax=Ahaetulla prasina TaxID=499056 RepID=UPI00264798D2|nr:beta-keratin-related protein-like [Ahaetulla prasina]
MSCYTPCCPPSCAIPSCASAPAVGLGGCGTPFALGSSSGFGGYRFGSGPASASSLGVLSGVTPSPISQIPPSEVTIQPPPVAVILPGPIIAASCEPVAVGGYSACAGGSFGGSYSRGLLGSRGICGPRRKYSICGSPC